MPPQRESSKCSLACEYCRIKKAKCSGIHPCGNCTDHNEPCIFPERRRRNKKRKEREQEMEDRLARMEVLLRAATQSNISDSRSVSLTEGMSIASPGQLVKSPLQELDTIRVEAPEVIISPSASLQEGDLHDIIPSPSVDMGLVFPTAQFSPVLELHQKTAETSINVCTIPAINALATQESVSLPVSPPISSAPDDSAPDISDQDNSNQQECASYLSICTLPAVEWISRQVGRADFLASARRLAKKVMRGERLSRGLNPVRTPEPDMETALKWTTAYFEKCIDSIFQIVERSEFEQHLQQYFRGDQRATESKPWYALRNTIYASGCRHTLSQTSSPAGFAESRAQSWKYFENALSVHTDLLYVHTDLVSIQALAIMAFHAEALGTPALEYMLVSGATMLSQSKGLHLMTNLPNQAPSRELRSRQRLWWTIYCYEKHLAYRTGRPSAIDDDYVSCPIPTSLNGGSAVSLEFVTKTIAHSQISSAVSKRLNSPRAMKSSPEVILAEVQELSHRLQQWRESMHPVFRVQAPFKNHTLPQHTHPCHLLYLHFCHYSLLISIHGVFCYPWHRLDIQASTNPEMRAQIEKSTEEVAEASRQIILAIQQIEITAALPVWLSFYFPLVGLINLFVCLLKNPLAQSVPSDLSLMDTVVGHFGYLEFISSSELEFPFPREIVSYARKFVQNARKQKPGEPVAMGHWQAPELIPGAVQSLTDPEISAFDVMLGLEDWCTFLPSFPQIGPVSLDEMLEVPGGQQDFNESTDVS